MSQLVGPNIHLQQEITDLRLEIANQQRQIVNLRLEITDQQRQNANLRLEITDQRRENAHLRYDYRTLEAAKDALKLTCNHLAVAVGVHKETILQLRGKISSLNNQIRRLEEQLRIAIVAARQFLQRCLHLEGNRN